MNIKKLITGLVIDISGTAAALVYVGEPVTVSALIVSAVVAGIVAYVLIRTTAW
jgi:hypothetical protein